MSTDDSLIKLTKEAIEKLDLAMSEVFGVSQADTRENYNIGKLGRAIGLIREFQEPIFEQCPDLKPPPPADYIPDPPLTKEQSAMVNKLSAEEINKIDQALLSSAGQSWRKVARIVGTTMTLLSEGFPGVPDIYYAQRVRHLVEEGMLESQGNLAYMRFSEVRILSMENE